MTKRLLDESEAFQTTDQESRMMKLLQQQQQPPKLPKRKDLCKLLGLNENDVDLCIVPEVKVAQKVALSHSNTVVNPKNTAKKKDLAKFLGVEGDIASTTDKCLDIDIANHREQTSTKSFLINWGQMVKSSVKGWKFDNENQHSDMEMDVPVQLRQTSAKEPERTHRKDLSKFLGFDDSDSEEIVFVRNANPNSSEQASINNSSLTRKSSDCYDNDTVLNDQDNDSDDSVGSLRSFDSFVRRSLRCGASSEFAIHIEEAGILNNNAVVPKRGATMHSLQTNYQHRNESALSSR